MKRNSEQGGQPIVSISRRQFDQFKCSRCLIAKINDSSKTGSQQQPRGADRHDNGTKTR